MKKDSIRAAILRKNTKPKWVFDEDSQKGAHYRVDKNGNYYDIETLEKKFSTNLKPTDDVYQAQKKKENKAVFDLNKTINISKNF